MQILVFIIQKYGMTALAWAASEGHEQVVDVLLKAGANPDIQDKVYPIIFSDTQLGRPVWGEPEFETIYI